MIQLTEAQFKQLDENLCAAIEELDMCICPSSEESFLSVGGKIGMALQKLYDTKQFIVDELIRSAKTKSSPPLDMSPEEEEAFHTLRNFNRSHHS